MKFTPLGGRVLVQPHAADDKSEGGIIIPDAAKDHPMTGEVAAVGLGHFTDSGHFMDPEVEVGDIVMFNRHSGIVVGIEDVMYQVMFESEIFGIFNDQLSEE